MRHTTRARRDPGAIDRVLTAWDGRALDRTWRRHAADPAHRSAVGLALGMAPALTNSVERDSLVAAPDRRREARVSPCTGDRWWFVSSA